MKYYTAAALGRALGIGEAEIKEYSRRGIIKTGRKENGLYNLEESAREIISALREDEDGNQDGNQRGNLKSANYQVERARFMRAKRQSAEYALKVEEGKLHKTEDLEFIISRILVGFKSRIRAIPARVSPQAAKMTSQEEVFELLKQVTDEALQELSDIDAVFTYGESGEGN